MPQSSELRKQSTEAEAFSSNVEADVAALIKLLGFPKMLKSLDKGVSLKKSEIKTVLGGGIWEQPSGLYDGWFETNIGRIVIQNGQRTDRATDPQLIPSHVVPPDDVVADSSVLTPDQLLSQLASAGTNPSCALVCEMELTRFDPTEQAVLLPLLWQYIVAHRSSNDRDELVAVGSAIRKYIAIMPMDRMGELAVLLESGNRSPLPIDLEIEVAKMIYRNFEVHPPVTVDSQPELAQRLWEIVQAYTNPRILLRDKHSAAASLAIEAIVAMRSSLAKQAWQSAVTCPYRWFAELVSDDLDYLYERWNVKNTDAAAWLRELQNRELQNNVVAQP